MGTKIVLAGNLPEGFAGTPQEFMEAMVALLRVEGDDSVVGGVTTGPTEPASQSDIWIDTSDPKFTRVKVYNVGYARWLPPYDIPIGCIMPSAPSGVHVSTIDGRPDWLLCDGATYQTADYPELYDFLIDMTAGNDPTWGPLVAAGGATAFCVPDLRGRVLLGAGQGVDYSSKKATLYQRLIGSKGTTIDGDNDADRIGTPGPNHPGYPGHEFIRYRKRPSVGVVDDPTQEMVSNTNPNAMVPPSNVGATGQCISAISPPATVVNFIIKAR